MAKSFPLTSCDSLEKRMQPQECRPPHLSLVQDNEFRDANRARLGRSRKTSCWPPTTPTNSPRTGKSVSGRVGQNTPTRD
ncbi:hypothetical protein TNCV_2922581 [Trichonephila clavipes]|nr:hypothetical protein TNCV_2922581 [Trichonephila clavipes]